MYRHRIIHLLAVIALILPAVCKAAAGEEATLPEGDNRSERGGPALDNSEAAATVSRYQDRISALETEHGAYHPRLAEELTGLGQALSSAGRHGQAAEAFERGLQISRINSGLHSFDQLPYLENLIRENKASGNWEELNENYQYLFWVHLRNYGDDDPRLVPVIDRITHSQIEIFNASPGLFTAKTLRRRKEMIEMAIGIIEDNYGENDPRLITMLNKLALTNYYIALQTREFGTYRYYNGYIGSIGHDDMFTTTYIPQVINTPSGPVVTYRQVSVPNMNSDAYLTREQARMFDRIDQTQREGLAALNRIETIHEHNPDLPLYSRAAAIVHQGDWRLLYGTGNGIIKYKHAYELLTDSGEGEKYIDWLFGKPRPLPALDHPPEEEIPGSTGNKPPLDESNEGDEPVASYIEVTFNVSEAGRVRNVEIISLPQGVDKSAARTIRRYLTNKRFRPRLEDGQPVMTTDVNIKYAVNEHGRLTSISGSR